MIRRAVTSPRRNTAGFLLVEALTAMAIGALLLVALGSLVSLTLRASGRTASASRTIEETSRVVSTLIREIETISPQRWAGAGAGFVFEGTPDRLAFARVRTLPDGRRNMTRVTLSSVGGIVSEWEQPLPADARDDPGLPAASAPIVLQDRFTVRFAYFSRLPDGREALTDHWTAAKTMPVAVRVSLTDKDGSPFGTIRIPVRVDAEPGCAAPGEAICSLAPKKAVQNASGSQASPDETGGGERSATP